MTRTCVRWGWRQADVVRASADSASPVVRLRALADDSDHADQTDPESFVELAGTELTVEGVILEEASQQVQMVDRDVGSMLRVTSCD